MNSVKFELISNARVREFNWGEFRMHLEKMIIGISRSTVTPINGERWEEVLYVILRHMGLNVKWDLGSHKPGADIWIEDFAISAKSGNLKGEKLVISSYRLTRFSELSEMIDFIDSSIGKNYDIHLSCARTDYKNGSRNYKVYLVDAHLFKANDMKWSEIPGARVQGTTGWRGVHSNGIIVEIIKKMSNQLWIYYPLELCNLIIDVPIDEHELGCNGDIFLRQ